MAKPSKLDKHVYRLHIQLVKRINDTHIFAKQAVTVLEAGKAKYDASKDESDKTYNVPSLKKGKIAKRTDKELRKIYVTFLERELYANFIVASVSQFESFLTDVLRLVFQAYPQKIKVNVDGGSSERTLSLDVLLDSDDLAAALNRVIEARLTNLFYSAPRDYLRFLNKIAGIKTTDSSFEQYIEIKATRDLLIHNSGFVNEVYLEKAGKLARGKVGDRLPIDDDYFDDCLANLKRLSAIVSRDIKATFG